jgi:2-keto-3-deoxy-L-rhamnonate aldolase RhmA
MNTAELRTRMAEGQVMFGLGLRLARTTEIAKVAKALGFDWLFVDMEHNPIGTDLAAQISVAALDAGIPPLVRVPGDATTMAARMLDGGAGGIIVPHVDTPAQIETFVERCRFAPVGRRSLGGNLPQIDYAALPVAETMRRADEQTLLCAMIESPEAVENAAAIAGVPGVDMLLVGSNDLAIEMGIPGQFEDPRLAAAYRKIIAGAQAHGKVAGLGGIYSMDLMRRYVPLGFRMVLLGSDFAFLAASARERLASARGIVESGGPT